MKRPLFPLLALFLLASLAGYSYQYAPPRPAQASIPADNSAVADAQVTFDVALPPETPPGDTIYIAGNFQGWNPGATSLTRQGLRATGTVTVTEGSALEFKFTRGAWTQVEKGS